LDLGKYDVLDFSIISENLDIYRDGAVLTIQLVLFSLSLGLILAVPLAILQNSGLRIVSWPVAAYSYFFRGTPLLIQIFLIYYGIGQFESLKETILWAFFKDPYRCALTAFVLNTAAYTCEILRGAMDRVPKGELEAAKAAGMSPAKILRRIILPNSFRRALPAYANEAIFMLHGTSLASTITLVELTGAARMINSRYYSPYEAFLFAGVLYMAMTFVMTGLFKLLEKRWYRHLDLARAT
jgi:arginine/ornithine transport system permease protein